MPNGTENSLLNTIENALKSLENDNTVASTNQLEAFINKVEALDGKALTSEQVNQLIEMARLIIYVTSL